MSRGWLRTIEVRCLISRQQLRNYSKVLRRVSQNILYSFQDRAGSEEANPTQISFIEPSDTNLGIYATTQNQINTLHKSKRQEEIEEEVDDGEGSSKRKNNKRMRRTA